MTIEPPLLAAICSGDRRPVVPVEFAVEPPHFGAVWSGLHHRLDLFSQLDFRLGVGLGGELAAGWLAFGLAVGVHTSIEGGTISNRSVTWAVDWWRELASEIRPFRDCRTGLREE